MDIWLDCIDAKTVQFGELLGILSGVTTNPSLISESEKSLEELLTEILALQRGPVAVQVTVPNHSGIIEQAETLRDFSERIIVKIPVTQEGLRAISTLAYLQIPVMATTIFTTSQALFACHAGADYLAPYFSKMESPLDRLETTLLMLDRYGFDTKLLVASLKTVEQIDDCLDLGVDCITIKKELFESFIADQPKTFESLERFSRDWKNAKPSKLLS
ncbi:MAG: Transaldolase [Chlamydiae bacterium]|nr:Transaldolase [Chlamydiota bacterium]